MKSDNNKWRISFTRTFICVIAKWVHLFSVEGSRTSGLGNEQIGDKVILKTYLALNRINVIEEDNLEKEFGLLDDILGLYSHLGSDWRKWKQVDLGIWSYPSLLSLDMKQ